MKQKHAWISLLCFIVLCLFVGLFAGLWTKQSVMTWYPTLNKPSWTPPSWVFAPVWSVLYLLIAISGWIIYQAEHSPRRSAALKFYGAQLALNFAWSFFFFSLQSPFLGLIDIVLLALLIVLTIVNTWPLSSLASLLLVPYLIWVIYAGSLNAAIWFLND